MKDNIIWEGVYQNFSDVPVQGPGFDGEKWISNSLEKIKSVRAEAVKSIPLPPVSNYREALLPLLAAMSHHEKSQLRILDFGGGIGFTYYQTMQALPNFDGIEYHIVEREPVCKAGREFFGDSSQNIFFHSELPEDKDGFFDIVHMGSSLQYIEDWKGLLSRLCSLSRKYLLLVDLFAGTIPTFASTQRYYDSRIPMWFLNVDDLIRVVNSSGYDLTFKSVYKPTIYGAEQNLPMSNFDETHRLKYACNLLFTSRKGVSS